MKFTKAIQITAVATTTYILLATFFGSPPSVVTKLWTTLHRSNLPGRQKPVADSTLSHIHNETLGVSYFLFDARSILMSLPSLSSNISMLSASQSAQTRETS